MTAPEPVAGWKTTKEFIKRQMVYPQSDLENKKSGKVIVSLDVDKDGNAYNHSVVSSFSDEASKEALEIARLILWKPGNIDGIAKGMSTKIEIVFSAKNYMRQLKKTSGNISPELKHPCSESYKIHNPSETNTPPTIYFTDPKMTFEKYVVQNMVFPEKAKELEISGTVRLTFVVERNGKASNIVIEKSVGGGCDNEAVRLIENTVWYPAVKNDSLVRSFATRDIIFKFGKRQFYEGNQY